MGSGYQLISYQKLRNVMMAVEGVGEETHPRKFPHTGLKNQDKIVIFFHSKTGRETPQLSVRFSKGAIGIEDGFIFGHTRSGIERFLRAIGSEHTCKSLDECYLSLPSQNDFGDHKET